MGYVESIRSQLPSHLKIVTSGNEWMDIQDVNMHKGVGMVFLKNLYDIQDDECMAFGDQMNDYELLKEVKYSYAMANAVDSIKDIAYKVILSNEEQGVFKKLHEYLEDNFL